MTSLPKSLSAFLITRYGEEEALAWATTPVAVPGRWTATCHANASSTDAPGLVQGLNLRDAGNPEPDARFVAGSPMIATAPAWEKHGPANMRHAAYHDPAFALANVAAKRERLRIWQQSVKDAETAGTASMQHGDGARRYQRALGFRDAAERAVLLDARAYADRADYNPVWTQAAAVLADYTDRYRRH